MVDNARKRRLAAQVAAKARLEENWDVAGWRTYVISGRILPERCMVWFRPASSKGVSNGGFRFTIELRADDSHISCVCRSDTPLSVHQLSDIVRSTVQLPSDYIAFLNRAYYDVVLDTWRDLDTNEGGTLPVYEPFLSPPPDGFLFRPGELPFNIPLEHSNDSLGTALHDLSQALRFPRRTLEYCRMALEAIRYHFDPPEEADWRKRWATGEIRMCDALRIDRKLLQRLEGDAAPGRHGEPLSDLTWPKRESALQLMWELVYRFRLYLDGVNVSTWAKIA